MDAQRLRNLTTDHLHTEIAHIYEDLGEITGKHGLQTTMLPHVKSAITPWLKEHVTDPHFWDGKYDITHVGEYELPEPTNDDRKAMFERFKALPIL